MSEGNAQGGMEKIWAEKSDTLDTCADKLTFIVSAIPSNDDEVNLQGSAAGLREILWEIVVQIRNTCEALETARSKGGAL